MRLLLRSSPRDPIRLPSAIAAAAAFLLWAAPSAAEPAEGQRAAAAVEAVERAWGEAAPRLRFADLDEDEAEDARECAADVERLLDRARGCVEAGRYARAMEHAAGARAAIGCASQP